MAIGDVSEENKPIEAGTGAKGAVQVSAYIVSVYMSESDQVMGTQNVYNILNIEMSSIGTMRTYLSWGWVPLSEWELLSVLVLQLVSVLREWELLKE